MPLNIADLRITSPAFEANGHIPTRHTKDGADVSPGLEFHGVPDGAAQLALICHDPDAPLPHGFTHWVVYGIPAGAANLAEGGGEYLQGVNGWGDLGYGGPQPPAGHGPHRYYFWLYALDTTIDAEPGLSGAQLLARIEDHIVEQNRLVGIYER